MDKQSPMFAVNNNFVCFTRENDGSEKTPGKAKREKKKKINNAKMEKSAL